MLNGRSWGIRAERSAAWTWVWVQFVLMRLGSGVQYLFTQKSKKVVLDYRVTTAIDHVMLQKLTLPYRIQWRTWFSWVTKLKYEGTMMVQVGQISIEHLWVRVKIVITSRYETSMHFSFPIHSWVQGHGQLFGNHRPTFLALVFCAFCWDRMIGTMMDQIEGKPNGD